MGEGRAFAAAGGGPMSPGERHGGGVWFASSAFMLLWVTNLYSVNFAKSSTNNTQLTLLQRNGISQVVFVGCTNNKVVVEMDFAFIE